MKRVTVVLVATLLGAVAGCGESTAPRFATFTAGDSLSDSGTFGFRFTVQGTAAAPNLVWTERVAAAFGTAEPCPRYRPAAGDTVESNPTATHCGGYAVAGARINPAGAAADLTASSVLQQITDLARERRPFSERDLVLISGGANDAADVFEGWLGAQSSAAAATAFQARMAEVLGQAAAANLTDTASRTAASQQYMAKLADNLADRIVDALINTNSARRIVVTNLPDITRTPRLRNALGALKLDPGPYADITAFGTSLATRFNQQLAARFANDSRVIVYDLYGSLNAWIGDPPPEFTQVQQPACPNTNPNLQALPTYSISTCTAAQLSSAATPADWWQRYLFADDFHPTPRGHEEAANQVIQLIRARGWN